jgi:hypothetical protein
MTSQDAGNQDTPQAFPAGEASLCGSGFSRDSFQLPKTNRG